MNNNSIELTKQAKKELVMLFNTAGYQFTLTIEGIDFWSEYYPREILAKAAAFKLIDTLILKGISVNGGWDK